MENILLQAARKLATLEKDIGNPIIRVGGVQIQPLAPAQLEQGQHLNSSNNQKFKGCPQASFK